MTRDIRTVRRIVALLAALAGLAEGASRRSLPVRFIVLAILRWALPVARDFVAGETGFLPPDAEDNAACGNGPADALLLAGQFRVLAAMLDAMLALACLFDGARRHRTFRPEASRPGPHCLVPAGMDALFDDSS